MSQNSFGQPFRETPAAMLGLNIDIADPGKGGGVGYHSGEADLRLIGWSEIIKSETQRVLDRSLNDVLWDIKAPVGLLRKKGVDARDLESRSVC